MKNYCYIETYGCSANKNNSEILAGLLRSNGYEVTNNIKIAEIIIINTCIVKGKTENKIKRRIQDISKEYYDKLLIISGCMPETDFKQIKELAPEALMLGTNHYKDIIMLIKDHDENKLTDVRASTYLSKEREEKLLLPKISSNKLISINQISEGCLGECTYCKTRFAKGSLHSYPIDHIVKSIGSDLKNGAKEVWITSQDNASYGLDMKEKIPLLPELLKKILSLKHRFRLRLGMMNPDHVLPILEDLIDVYNDKKMYKFLHVPVQSASDNVLKTMKRKYSVSEVETIINMFKKEFPMMTFATDIITGFPTETSQDHKENIMFIEKFRPDVFNLSKYSSHKGTVAGTLPVLDIKTINKRATELMSLHRKTAQENKSGYKDKKINVFVNSKTKVPHTFEARDEDYNIVLISSTDKSILGKNIEVKIKTIGVHHMIGVIE